VCVCVCVCVCVLYHDGAALASSNCRVENECRPKCGDAMQLGVKAEWLVPG